MTYVTIELTGPCEWDGHVRQVTEPFLVVHMPLRGALPNGKRPVGSTLLSFARSHRDEATGHWIYRLIREDGKGQQYA